LVPVILFSVFVPSGKKHFFLDDTINNIRFSVKCISVVAAEIYKIFMIYFVFPASGSVDVLSLRRIAVVRGMA
jgi:hypothetical protein